jgi:predicted RecA/RadA family phage recombinase
MRNYVQEGIVLTVVAANPIASGDLVQSGSIVGVAACDAEVGQEVECRVEGVFEIPKIAPADVLNAGSLAKATFTAGIGKVGITGTVNIGWVSETAGAGTTSVRVRLVPSV